MNGSRDGSVVKNFSFASDINEGNIVVGEHVRQFLIVTFPSTVYRRCCRCLRLRGRVAEALLLTEPRQGRS